MQDTTTTLPDGDPVKDNSTPWSTHNARTLARALLDAADVLDAFEQATETYVEGVPV